MVSIPYDDARRRKRSSSSDSHLQKETTRISAKKSKTTDSAELTETREPDENTGLSTSIVQQGAKPIEIDARDRIYSVAFIGGKHIVSGGLEGKIRRWQVKDGNEVGTPMDAGRSVWSIAVSRDGTWIVVGTNNGRVIVWNAEAQEKLTEFQGHDKGVYAVDTSPDGTRIATGSGDKTACVWSLSTGHRLLGPWTHNYFLAAVRFSPDGRSIATGTWGGESVRIYDGYNGHLLVDFPRAIQVSWLRNGCLAWTNDSTKLFALSRHDGSINCLDVSVKATLSKWSIHNTDSIYISLASNGTFLAASDKSSVSFWDTKTHKQIGSAIEYTHGVHSMAISEKYDIVVAGEQKITLRSLRDILPSPYLDTLGREIRSASPDKADLEDTIRSLRMHDERSKEKIASLEDSVQQLHKDVEDLQRTNQELRTQLADPQRTAKQAMDNLNGTIGSLRRAHLHLLETSLP